MTGPASLVNLADRRLGAGVIAASDEFFGEKENLLRPGPPAARPGTFGHKGQVVDGWETRRRRGPGEDYAIVRLGAAGVISEVVVDTTHFTGNFPAECAVSACGTDGYPGLDGLLGPGTEWAEIVPRSRLAGDAENRFAVTDGRRFTHVRLAIHPDGGVARLRVNGEVIPDPRLLDGLSLDLVAAENGGTVTGASDRFYSPPENMIAPGLAAVMGDGWETRRRRGPGSDWAEFRLAAAGRIRQAVIDTSRFLGNAPAACTLLGRDAWEPGTASAGPARGTHSRADGEAGGTGSGTGSGGWSELLPRTPLQPDTRHRFRLPGAAAARRVTHVRLEIHPDGGLARLRLPGELDPAGRAGLGLRWFDRVPAGHLVTVLAAECGLAAPLAEQLAGELARQRPCRTPDRLDSLLADGLPGREAAAAARIRTVVLGRAR